MVPRAVYGVKITPIPYGIFLLSLGGVDTGGSEKMLKAIIKYKVK